jgi:hypothetical protein
VSYQDPLQLQINVNNKFSPFDDSGFIKGILDKPISVNGS